MDVKLGVTQWSLPGNGMCAVRIVADAGLDGLQIELGSYELGYPMAQPRMQDMYLDEAAKYGISFPSIVLNDINIYPMIADKDSEKYKIGMDMLKTAVQVADRMKVPVVMIPSFLDNDIKTPQDMDRTVEALKYVCELAGEKGIEISSEGTISYDKHLEIVERVGYKNISIFYDSMNYKLFKGYDQAETLLGYYDKMTPQLHVKDGKTSDVKGPEDLWKIISSALLGKGDTGFYKTIEILKEKNYKGWIILENYYQHLPLRLVNEDQFEIMAQDIRILREAIQ
ncbi:MAG: sugar phosphate isomerase/epimerase family protein [Christensenellales bacterium]|jgi:sugar phosphate isomerase/epimerase